MGTEPHPFMVEFEQRTSLGPPSAAILLGLPYVTYAQYRARMRNLKPHHVKHMEVILLLPKESLRRYIEREVHGPVTQD